MILLQAIMGFPVGLIMEFIIVFIVMYVIRQVLNFILKTLYPANKFSIQFYWVIIFSLIITLIFIYKLLTFDGRWIN